MNYALILSVALPLFLIMDPLGNTPMILVLLKDKTSKEQRLVMLRELFFALVFVVLFYFVGETVLDYLKIDQSTIRVSGGIILFIMAIKMIFPQIEKNNATIIDKDPFIVPIAIPLIAGPSLIATVSLYAHQVKDPIILFLAIGLAWMANVIIYMCMPCLKSILRDRGLKACERLMGLLLMLISVQMFLDGLTMYVGDMR